MQKRNPASLLGTMYDEIQTGVLSTSRFAKELTAIDSLLCFAIHSCGFERDAEKIGTSLAVFESIRKNAERKSLRFRPRITRVFTVG
jgi:hypothetical protein